MFLYSCSQTLYSYIRVHRPIVSISKEISNAEYEKLCEYAPPPPPPLIIDLATPVSDGYCPIFKSSIINII